MLVVHPLLVYYIDRVTSMKAMQAPVAVGKAEESRTNHCVALLVIWTPTISIIEILNHNMTLFTTTYCLTIILNVC